MTVAANPLCHLASGTCLQSCVYCFRLRFSPTIISLPMQKHYTSTMRCSIVFTTTPIDNQSQQHPLHDEMAFNRHSPCLDHRGR
jgi:hypothetical protein